MTTSIEFIEWLNRELDERGWDQVELARRAGVGQAHVSRVLSQQRNPGPDFCRGIARAFKMAPERVFRVAGLLPAVVIGGEQDVIEIVEQMRYLSADDLASVRAVVQSLYERRSKYREDTG